MALFKTFSDILDDDDRREARNTYDREVREHPEWTIDDKIELQEFLVRFYDRSRGVDYTH